MKLRQTLRFGNFFSWSSQQRTNSTCFSVGRLRVREPLGGQLLLAGAAAQHRLLEIWKLQFRYLFRYLKRQPEVAKEEMWHFGTLKGDQLSSLWNRQAAVAWLVGKMSSTTSGGDCCQWTQEKFFWKTRTYVVPHCSFSVSATPLGQFVWRSGFRFHCACPCALF